MLDLFTILSKGGIVLWYFQGTSQLFTSSVNALIRSVILQERSGSNSYTDGNLTLQYKLDNEFELIFVVAYQKILQLSYIDKFLNDIQLEFRDKYKDVLHQGRIFQDFEFEGNFRQILISAEKWAQIEAAAPKKMRTFEESAKSKKTIASMIEKKNDSKPEKGKEKEKETKKSVAKEVIKPQPNLKVNHGNNKTEVLDEAQLLENRLKMLGRLKGGGKNKETKDNKSLKSPQANKKGKESRIWDNSGKSKDSEVLCFSKPDAENFTRFNDISDESARLLGTMKGDLPDMLDEGDDLSDEEEEIVPKKQQETKKKGKGMFSMFKSLVGSKEISKEDMEPILDKLRDHMIGKNVATEIAHKLCESVAAELEGRVLGTFTTVASTVRSTLDKALVQILSPRRRVNILRDVLEIQRLQRPYVITFCGVNGVGKSTNLAKIAFWLIENNLRVLIAACDTFRAGAVEQLRTHTRHLSALHPPETHSGKLMVQLFEKGYGKDAAAIAMEAINYARDYRFDVVLVDTAGRMQDNEPLMRALAKLIKVNQPDLVLFVGEALVGNEAVDQLVKFNQALADHSTQDKPHLIDGIMLTKFDTIDDKVGAAVSMTYITGQPIVFVGTGQTYTDLKNLNAKAVVSALMK